MRSERPEEWWHVFFLHVVGDGGVPVWNAGGRAFRKITAQLDLSHLGGELQGGFEKAGGFTTLTECG